MNYIFTGNIPSTFAWKNIINNTINDFEHKAKLIRMEGDRDFDRFIKLFKFGNPADIWRYGTTTKKLHVARSVSKLWTFPPKAKNCSL
jgi:hypothetical protein